MSLEAQITEQLQELKKWQQYQEQELIHKQQKQRQKLTNEQSRMFEVLSSSIDEMHLEKQSLKNLIEEHNKKEEEANLIDFDASDNECSTLQESSDCSKVEVSCTAENNEDSISETPRAQLSLRSVNGNTRPNVSYNSSYSHNNTSTDLLPANMTSYCSEKSQKSLLIDDIPIPSPKKDFSALLEEKLKDVAVEGIEKTTKPIIKRPFLKKGEGLARFKPNSNNNKTSKSTIRHRSLSFTNGTQSNDVKSKSAYLDRCNFLPKTRKYDTKKSISPGNVKKAISSRNGISPGNVRNSVSPTNVKKAIAPIQNFTKKSDSPTRLSNKKTVSSLPSTVQTKLNLKNFSAPQKKPESKSNFLQQKKNVFEKEKTSVITPDVSSSDLEVKTKRELEEVRIFELLEDKAENSSFCSTSSTVIAFLQQSSTPLKHKALLHSASKHHISLNNFGDQTLEEIVSNTESNNLFVPKVQINDENHNVTNWEKMSKANYTKNNKRPVLPYGTDVDMNYDTKSNQDTVQDQNNLSLHVRFAEYNEYKTMSDTSSISSESEQVHNEKDQGIWSDNSETTDTSDIESISQGLKAVSTSDNKPEIPYICIDKESGDSEYEDESQNTCDEDNGQDNGEDTENDYEVESKNDTVSSVDTVIEKNECKSLFKSELLRKRLLELEHEIEIFRKESAALNILKQKLQEERTNLCEERINMQRSLKEKEAALEAEKKKTESIVQEEKRRLAREKAALESRMKDAYEKAQKSKQERQEIQLLREQLEELKDEYDQKEAKWSATSARQRSQIRVLQAENVKLKHEIEQFHEKQKLKLKRIINPNTRAIHQINKCLGDRKKISNSKNKESIHIDEPIKAPQAHEMNYEIDLEIDEEKLVEEKKIKIPKSIESIARARNLYEHLLKDAIEEYGETQINRKHLQNIVVETCERGDEASGENNVGEENQCDKEIQDQEDAEYDETNTIQDEALYQVQSNNCQENYYDNNTEQPKSSESKQGIKEICHPDGRIEYWYPNGNVKKIFPDRGITKVIYYNGDVRETDKDGVIKYFYAQTRTWHTTLPDGYEILEFPNGQVERRSKNGMVEVSYPDGSVKIVQENGTEKWALKDGTIAETTADGDKIIKLPNGQVEVHTKDHKRRQYPDGTVKLMYLDGTQETRYANGRIRLKDKDGNLLMDTHQ